MKVENTENNRKIQQVAATMAIEDMYMSKDCLQGLINVDVYKRQLKNMPNNLSGGQQQRVAIARALITRCV